MAVTQQIDVKGAYLNSILKEHIYMRQPEEHNDGTLTCVPIDKDAVWP